MKHDNFDTTSGECQYDWYEEKKKQVEKLLKLRWFMSSAVSKQKDLFLNILFIW